MTDTDENGNGKTDDPAWDEYTIPELLEIAEDWDVDAKKHWTKAEIIAALEAAEGDDDADDDVAGDADENGDAGSDGDDDDEPGDDADDADAGSSVAASHPPIVIPEHDDVVGDDGEVIPEHGHCQAETKAERQARLKELHG